MSDVREKPVANPWFEGETRYDRDQQRGPARVRHRRQPEHQGDKREFGLRAEMRRDLRAVLITGPVVVPVWWALWKVCDTLWSMK